jgi:hypothetical protein
MRLLFSMRHVGSLRLFEPALRALARRGHEVDVLVSRRESIEWGSAAAQLTAEYPAVRWHWADDLPPNAWLEFATVVRLWLDYLRYFDPRYADAPKLRVRAEDRVPAFIVRACRRWPLTSAAGRAVLARVLRTVERVLPRQSAADATIAGHKPDAMLLTPLVHLGSPQVELLRSAQAMRVPTALCVGSWDHLSSKSVIRNAPDRVFVWNATQHREAVELHGLSPARVIVTGAQCYDPWFGRTPLRTRAESCRRAGLPADRPFVLWVCSALFPGSPVEAEFVTRWVERVRRSTDPALSSAGILIRPHPFRLDEWEGVDLSPWAPIARRGALPIDEDTREDYFEALHYASAVAGLNTSAFIEAAIVDRPVHALLLPEFHENQEGTIHFRYLLPENGGPLIVARSLEEHVQQLARSIAGTTRSPNRAFVSSFVRPAGVERHASDVFADAVEALARVTPEPATAPAWARVARPLLLPFIHLTGRALANAGDRTSHELRRLRQKAQYREDKVATERRLEEARERERRDKASEAERARQEVVAQRERTRLQAEREKAALKREKARHKAQHERTKRRAVLKRRIKEKLGLA